MSSSSSEGVPDLWHINEKGNQKSKIPIALRNQILNTIRNNRLSIIVGGTGCGKSTLVPQLLVDQFGEPILCTQPRRLAVVAVSTHVAQQRNTVLGQEVGYHVGQNRVATNQTRLIFATAGILLEELRSNGIQALSKFKVVLIDECHERSAESDLCLAIIKSFMTKHPHDKMRIVLMSATFNHGRYASYFNGVPGCESIDTITLQTASSNMFYTKTEAFYLDHVLKMVPTKIRDRYLKSFERKMRLDPDSELTGNNWGKSLSDQLLMLIMILVSTLHREEPSHAIFLIFAPTYRHLEQIHGHLTDLISTEYPFFIDVLHSSVDIEDCLKSMDVSGTTDIPHGRHRRILLASAIADSSVTIPNVTCVIDTCRALQVKWNASTETHSANTVWASKSICDQRRGRTGRTCPGRVFRLCNQSFYINGFEEWDVPQITHASCRDEVLALLSSTNKAVSNPEALLNRCMDPPPQKSVKKAIDYLKSVGACKIEKVGRKERVSPTHLGKLLAALPYTVSDCAMIVKGAECGYLHEALILVSILSTRPYPILHRFGEDESNEDSLRTFYPDVNPKDPKSLALASFSAYLFWYIHWHIKIRTSQAKSRFLRCTRTHIMPSYENSYSDIYDQSYDLFPNDFASKDDSYDCNIWDWDEQTDEAHTYWCKEHDINPTSVRAIAESVEVALKVLYKKEHEPIWLRYQKASPVWNDLFEVTHDFPPQYTLYNVFGEDKAKDVCNILLQLQNQSSPIQCKIPTHDTMTQLACIHFLKGNCTYGSECKNAHSYTAPRPPCRFFFTVGCTNSACLYSHEKNEVRSNMKLPPSISIHSRYEGGALAWYTKMARNLLIFGEADFSFTMALSNLGAPPLISTTYDEKVSSYLAETYCSLTNIDATRCHENNCLKRLKASKKVTSCAWNFPFTGEDENESIHTSLLSGAFMSVAHYLESNPSHSTSWGQFGIALQGDQFSRWSVLRSAQQARFHLEWWDEFDYNLFPGYYPKRSNGDRFPLQYARFYVFRLASFSSTNNGRS